MTLLNIDVEQELEIDLKNLIGESVAVLGIKGSGKTNTAAVLIEELLTHGLPLTIVDIEGEYWGLKERYEILVVGRSTNVDIEVDVKHASRIAEFSVLNGISVILDLSEFSQEEMFTFLLSYFKSLWTVCFTARKPYEIVLEEAHEFVPQSVRTPLKEVLTRVALRGRKRGLGIISVSQRSAKVEKDILTQASIVFLHRVVHPVDLRVYQDILPLTSKEVETVVGSLHSGQAIVMSNYKVNVVQVRLRHTFHVGATPELVSSAKPTLRRLDTSVVKELVSLLQQTSEADDADTSVKKLEEILAQKEIEIEQLKKLVEKLQLDIELLSKLEVSLGQLPSDLGTLATKLGVLEVEQLRAMQVVASEKQLSTPESSFIVQPDKSDIVFSGDSTQGLDVESIKRQEKRFNYLLNDLRQLPRFHRSILVFLTEREDTSFTVVELAKWLHISVSTIENRPPLELIKMGLIARKGRRGHFYYESSVRSTFAEVFPDLNSDHLLERLLQHLHRS